MATKNTSGGSNLGRTPLLGLMALLVQIESRPRANFFRKYVNPGLKTMLSAIGFDKKSREWRRGICF